MAHSRRDFLKAAALLPASMQAADSRGSIIVLGAGLAGLTSAFELQNLGYSVTVLEAQMRPGGRVHTLREAFAPGLYTEAGAARIPRNHDLTQHYAKLMGLTLLPGATSNTARSLYYVRGKRVIPDAGAVWPLDLTPEERGLGLAGLRRKYIEPAVQRALDNGFERDPYTALKPWDRLFPGEWLRTQGASPAAIELLTMGFGTDFGSAAWLLLYTLNLRGAGASFHIEGGNDRLPFALAARVKDVRYGQPVTAVTQTGDQVQVVTRGGLHLSADRVVSTLPSPVTGSIFGSRISPARLEATRNQAYSHTSKVFLQTRTRFWLNQQWSGNATTDLPIERLTPDTGVDANGRGILTVYPIAQYANQLEQMPEATRERAAIAQASRIFPEIEAELEGAAFKCWGTDPWQRGAFTVQRPGHLSYLEVLAKPEGRIHFAGEHTSRFTGWMQGAFESASRVVGEIARDISQS